MNPLRIFTLLPGLLLMAACTPAPTPLVTPTKVTPQETAPPEAVNEESLFNARVDLAMRLSLPPEEIVIVAVETVDWPDSSLGCGQPGEAYLTVITPGFRIVFSAGGASYFYHTDSRGNVVLCSPDGLPQPPPIQLTPGEIQDGIPWMPVDPVDPPESSGD